MSSLHTKAACFATLTALVACTSTTAVLHHPAAPHAKPPVAFARPTPPTIARENDLAGTRDWRLDVKRPGSIDGYAWASSVAAGDPLTLSVGSVHPFTGDVYRLGWYHGTGGRLIAKLPQFRAQPQPSCLIRGPRNTVTCGWRATTTIRTSTAWVSGVYLVKLLAHDGSEAYIPFVVRERTPRAPILVQVSVNTWQAYNSWGGASLYKRIGVGFPHATADRSRAVTFDRPYEWPGAGQIFDFEYPLIYWLESQGEDVAYGTDVDLDKGLDSLPRRRIFIAAGHDEYYSTSMRDALTRARAEGVNLMFLGGNDVFRHIRFEDGDRVEVMYKWAREDPLATTDPKMATGDYRAATLDDPEQAVLGEMHQACPQRTADWVPTRSPAWLFARTGFTRGSVVRLLFGYEYDAFYPAFPAPDHVQLIARGRTTCGFPSSTLYVAASGAIVFDAGSIWFDCGLGPGCDDPWLRMPRDAEVPIHPSISVDPRLRRLVDNLLNRMLVERARAHVA